MTGRRSGDFWVARVPGGSVSIDLSTPVLSDAIWVTVIASPTTKRPFVVTRRAEVRRFTRYGKAPRWEVWAANAQVFTGPSRLGVARRWASAVAENVVHNAGLDR